MHPALSSLLARPLRASRTGAAVEPRRELH
jgi:hypothetical protein